MNAYLPRDAGTMGLVVAMAAGILAIGFAITRIRSVAIARTLAWALMILGGVGVERLCAHEPAGVRMVSIIVILLWAVKAVVAVESQVGPACRAGPDSACRKGTNPARLAGSTLTPLGWLGFAFWPGMRPALFAKGYGPPLPGAGKLLGQGSLRLAAGAGLAWLARIIWLDLTWPGLSEQARRSLATVVLLAGLSLILHFGIFNLIAAAWRLAGIDCRPLFRAPLSSRSLAEFWGRRWNLAFTEMTAVCLYRPLSRILGKPLATVVSFLGSGVLHELAISVPVNAGYGLPFLYFVLHAGLVHFEHFLERRGHSIENLGWFGHVWTLGWLALPMPILFHPYFLNGVVWPMLGMEIAVSAD